jgi:CHAD domain-containing protein
VVGLLAAEHELQAVLDRLDRRLDELAADGAGAGRSDGDAIAARRARHLLQRRVGRELDQARGASLVALGSPRYRCLADRLSMLAEDLPVTAAAELPCARALPPQVLAAYRQLDDAVARLEPTTPDQAWHEAGRLARHGRYAAELCEPVFGSPARGLTRQLGRVTEILGRHQDAAAAARAARAVATTPRIAPATSFALGVLHASERAAVASARRDLGDVWPEVSGKRWRLWLNQR